MVSDKAEFDWGADLDDGSYKSCFARSVAVNSQYKQTKSLDPKQLLPEEKVLFLQEGFQRSRLAMDEGVKLRKNSRANIIMEDGRRLSCSSIGSSRRASICSSRIAEIPVENIVQQSKVETLQWQLKEIEKSREMYKALMKQVVTFLERAHKNLELLGTRLNPKQTVPRSKSEHQIAEPDLGDYSTFKDFTWRRVKKQETPEEIPPEKLSQEAFRLLRTAQSLLNTQEPKLTVSDDSEDIQFLAQLAKEFPLTPESKPQRTTSFSLSPKLLTPDNEHKIATAFNRKLSLQLHESRRNPFREFCKLNNDNFLSSTVNEFIKEKRGFKNDSEKSNSPPAGSVSSVEDESGFSSMNSFQDVGLPIVDEEVSAKSVLLKSMLQNNECDNLEEDLKLWQRPNSSVAHKRWSSTPVTTDTNDLKQATTVLWV